MDLIRTAWTHTLLVAGALLAWEAAAQGVAQQASAQDYTWHAELAGLDERAGTVTVKARVEDHADIDFSAFSEGDRLTLSWTGWSRAAGVRDLSRDGEGQGELTLPVEFVATELGGEYVTFRVRVPEESVPTLASLEPGEWITATTPRGGASWSSAVTDIGPYGAAS